MKIPDGMHEEDVLFLSDILPTGYQAAEMGNIKDGETVVVFGCGPVGLFAQKSAWLLGAGRVIAVDRLEYRLDFARRYNDVETLNLSEGDVVTRLLKMTDGRGADVCIDAVGLEADGSALQTALGVKAKVMAGSAVSIAWAIDAVRKGGDVVIIGVYGPPYNVVPIGTAMNKGITMRMNQCNVKRYMPHLLEHIRAGRIDAKAIVTHRVPLEHARDAYELFEKKKDHCIKCVLVPPEAA
jgi:threonine dehydrogenase-like Zn-dependent dehydrogenase